MLRLVEGTAAASDAKYTVSISAGIWRVIVVTMHCDSGWPALVQIWVCASEINGAAKVFWPCLTVTEMPPRAIGKGGPVAERLGEDWGKIVCAPENCKLIT